MHTQDLIFDESRKWQVVEYVVAVPPNIGVPILPANLFVETIHRGDLPRLVVASQQRYSVGMTDLEQKQHHQGLHGVVTTVHEVTDEDVAH